MKASLEKGLHATLVVATSVAAACGGGRSTVTETAPTPPRPPAHAAAHPGPPTAGAPAHGHGHGGHGHGQGGHDHDFSDVHAFERLFDDPGRDAWQLPAQVVTLLALDRGMTVADLGAGTGYFLRHLAAAVGDGGTVLALDVEPGMVDHMAERVAREGLGGVQVRRVAPDDPGLPPDSVDRVLVVNTWHHIGDRVDYARALRTALRPGGHVLVVDFTRESPHGPPPHLRLPAGAVVEELRAGGLEAAVVDEALPYQYAVRARRP